MHWIVALDALPGSAMFVLDRWLNDCTVQSGYTGPWPWHERLLQEKRVT